MPNFTWIPFYKELAQKLLSFKDKQSELIDFLDKLKNEGISSIPLIDKDSDGKEIKLDTIDPFTFFATFNRGITNENRIRILKKIKEKFQIGSELPSDFSGVPVVSNFKSWFFAFKKDRKGNDISLLWSIAEEAIRSPDDISESLFLQCLQIRGVTITNLSMGFYWMNPETFSACDSRIKEYLTNRQYRFPKIYTLKDYKEHLIRLKEFLPDVPFYSISFDAWKETKEVNEPEVKYAKIKYWAGGYHWGGTESKLSEFFEKGIWQIGNSKEVEKRESIIKLINQVSKGDYIILKSYGGTNILTISGIGQVVDTSKSNEGTFDVNWINKKQFYKGNPPSGKGAGNWWGTLFQVTRQSEIQHFFIDQLMTPNDTNGIIKYWLYAPGPAAEMWDEFYSQGIMGIEVDALGDLKDYPNKPSIVKRFQELKDAVKPSSHKNDATACDEFANKMSVGDVVIVKTKQKSLLGYGLVTSDYYFDDERQKYKSCRKVKWEKTGNWTTDFQLVQKTLTDVTKYPTEHPDYKFYYERLMAIIQGTYTPIMQSTNYMKHSLNQILFGPPGTGKTYNSINHALAIVESKELEVIENESDENRGEILRRFQSYVDSGQVVFTTFHQSMSYEDFIEGIKPTEDEGQLQYDVQRGVFRLLVDDALANFKNAKLQTGKKSFDTVWVKFLSPLNEEEPIAVKMKKSTFHITHVNDRTIFFDKNSGESKHTLSINTLRSMYDAGENQIIIGGLQPYYAALLGQLLAAGKESGKVEQKNYVLIIDEINRGNVAQIFGELITLIETDKRFGNKEALTVTLPYSKKKDFSIPANLYIVGTMNTADRSVEALDTALRRRFTFVEMPPRYDFPELESEIIDGITLEIIMKTLNTRIEKLLDKDHLIGHSYFLSVDNITDLQRIFHQNIMPLLQEYFYGDFAKIGLVLGEAFFEKNEVSKKNIFARFAHDAADELNEKPVYRLKQTWAEGEFEKAIVEMVNP